jgi:Mce-associated membrane protein
VLPPPPLPTVANQPWIRTPAALALIVLAVLVIAAGVVDLMIGPSKTTQGTFTKERTAAVITAKAAVPAVLSYDYRKIAGYPAAAESRTTGEFKTSLTKLINTAVLPAAQTKHIVTSTVITATSVVQASSHTVVLLIFIDQQTTSTTLKSPQVQGSRVRVVMQRVGTRWLIAQFQPV